MRDREEEHRRLLAVLIEEEAEYQGRMYGNDISRMWEGITPASLRFIAQFRLADRQTVPYDLRDTRCSICLEDLQINQHFAQWPCSAKHTFHFNCMLDILRAENTCPLCRHPIELADVLSTQPRFRLMLGRMMSDVFN